MIVNYPATVWTGGIVALTLALRYPPGPVDLMVLTRVTGGLISAAPVAALGGAGGIVD